MSLDSRLRGNDKCEEFSRSWNKEESCQHPLRVRLLPVRARLK